MRTKEKPTPVSGPTQTADQNVSNRWEAHPRIAKALRVAIVLFPLALTFALTWAAGRYYPPERVGLNRWVWWIILMILSWILLRGLNHLARRATPIAAMLQVSMIFPDEAPSRARAALRSTNGKKILKQLREAEAAGKAPPEIPSSDFLAGMLRALAEHEPLTRGHSERVRAYTDLIAEEMDLPEEDAHKLRWAALLHDIGKLEVPAEILNSKDRPTEEEWEILKTHPTHGGHLMEPLREWLGEWALAAEEHHLRWDGRGYPKSLAGTEISLAGRIVAVADAYDVMTSIRSYKKGMSPEAARKELARCSGTQFDPAVVRAFLAVGVGRLRAVLGPFGSIVGLIETFRIPLNPGGLATAGYAAAGAVATIGGAVTGAAEPALPEAIPFVEPLSIESSAGDVAEDVVGGEFVIEGTGGTGPMRITIGPAEQGDVEATAVTIFPDEGDDWSFDLDYTPEEDFFGVDAFNYTICDANDDCVTGRARITVTAVNDPPVAVDDLVTPVSFGSSVITPLENDTDADQDPLRLRYLSTPANGTVVVAGDSVRYTPNPDFRGTEILEYDVVDESGAVSTGRIVIDLSNLNAPPRAVADDATTDEDTAVVIDVLGNDSDVEDGAPTGRITVVTAPANGTVAVNADRTLRYVPDADHFGSDTFTYRVADSAGKVSAPATVSVTIEPVNDGPTLVPGGPVVVGEDSGGYAEAWASGISPGPGESGQSVLLTVSNDNPGLFAAEPAISANGTLTFTPAADRIGSALVSVVLTDDGGTARGGANAAGPFTFAIDVVAVNDAPSFTPGPDVALLEDAGPQVIPWATAIAAGPPDESGQTVLFSVTNDNPGLFASQPTIAVDGTLEFEVEPDVHGLATVSVSLADDGGTQAGGIDTSPTTTFSIEITPVNDAPTFVPGAGVTVAEDSGAYTAPWATSVEPGPIDEAGQSLIAAVTNDNPALFAVDPQIDVDGTLTFIPAAHANGTATVSVTFADNGGTANGGADTSLTETFLIVVSAVNDAPTFTPGADPVTVDEDSGAHSSVWATAISPGPADEAGETLAFGVNNDNTALFTVQPAIAADGTLTFTPAPNAFGSATVSVALSDDGGTVDGGEDITAAELFTITVRSVNDAPAFTAGPDPVTVGEDSGAHSSAWATAISAGPANESGQTTLFTVGATNPALFSVQPAIAADGTFTFTPAPEATGTATVTVILSDDGGTANGGTDTSAPTTFDIVIADVNDAPSFQPGAGPVTVFEDSGAFSAPWATAMSPGPADEAGQALTFGVTNDDNALFAVQPAIAADGTLTFTPAPHAYGTATVTVILSDDGGTANGGTDTSAPATFDIVIDPVNDEPTFTAGPDPVTVDEDTGAHSVPWATAVGTGPTNEAGQTGTFAVNNTDNTLFAVQPAMSPDGTLTFALAPDAYGIATVDVTLSDDGGTANGGDDTSPTVTFDIVVNNANEAPSFTPGAALVAVLEDSLPYSAPWASAMSPGPAEEAGQTLTFTVTNDDNALFAVQPAIAPDGTLTFTPAADAYGTATVTVTLSDDGGTANGGTDTSAPSTFDITLDPVNDPPAFTVGPDPVAVDEDSGPHSSAWATAMSAGPPNEAGQTLTFTVTNNKPALFSVQPAMAADGTLTFTPAPDAFGNVSVNVRLWDDGGTANGGDDKTPNRVFDIVLNPLPDDPTAVADAYTAYENNTLARAAADGVLANDFDVDGDALTVDTVPVAGPSNGTLVLNGDGSFDYTPNAGYTGPDSFTYSTDDGTGRTSTATVSIDVAMVPSVVVSQFSGWNEHSGGNFVELHNADSVPVDISGWQIRISDEASITLSVTIPPDTIMAPGGFFLAAKSGEPHAALADVTFGSSLPNELGIGIWTGAVYADQVGNVDSAQVSLLGEGRPLPSFRDAIDTNLDLTYRRLVDFGGGHCQDTNDNLADFHILPSSTAPRNSGSVPEPCGPPNPPDVPATDLVFSEFRTEGPLGARDDFVEIFNPTSAAIGLGGLALFDGADVEYIFPAVALGPGEHFLVAGIDYVGPADGTMTGSGGIRKSEDMTLWHPIAGVVAFVDMGMNAPALPQLDGFVDESYQRVRGGCTDSGVWLDDYAIVPIADPQTLADPPTPCP